MKYLKLVSLSVVFILSSFLCGAQLGGVLKKAKEKVTSSKSSGNAQETPKDKSSNINEVKNGGTLESRGSNTPKGYFLVTNPLGKITFSNQLFTTGTSSSKASFHSNEFIYGRLQLNSGTVKEAFKIGNKAGGIPFYSLEYIVVVYKNGEKKFNNKQIWNSCLVRDADLSKNYFDFDVLPNPQNATTIISAVADFSAGKSTAPLYSSITPQVFSEDGVYKVDIILRNSANDAWGKPLEEDKWPTFEADFDFTFSSDDIATLKKNKELASTNAENKMQGITTAAEPLPKQWSEKSSSLVMGLTQPQLVSMYENSFTSKMDAHTVVKFHSSSTNGGWTVVSNDFGIPTYRYSNQWYTIFIKYANGKTCFHQGFGLRQQYIGAGKYGTSTIDKNEYHFIDCEKMK